MQRGPAAPGDEERRWAEAMTILEAGGDTDAQRRARNHRLLVIATVLVVLTVIAATLGVLAVRHSFGHPGQQHHRQHGARWREIMGLILSTAGLAVEVVGFVRWRRSGGWATAWRTPLLPLTRRQRRDLLRQVRGQQPPDPDRLPLLRDLARRVRDNDQGFFGPQALVTAGTCLLLAGNAVRSTSLWLVLLGVPSVAPYPVAVAAARRASRRASTFLSQHPEPSQAR